MTYLIDANCFIEPKNRYYGFDICPGFWDWLDQQNKQGNVFSIDKVSDELTVGNDELAKWAKQKGTSFFRPTDSAAISVLGQITTWLTSNPTFKAHDVRAFMSKADLFLVAHGLAHGHIIVTR